MLFRLTCVLSLIISGVACSQAPVGSKKRPFTMYYIPSVDAQAITSTAEKTNEFIAKYVSQKLYQKDEGFYVKSAVPQSYVAVVEAFGTDKADFAVFTVFSYILARDIKKYPVEAVMTVLRGEENEKTYKGQIITRADSGIKKLEDLKGKKFAFVDPASTSGYILPLKLFNDLNIQLGDTVFSQRHDNVVTMVYQKQVDAGATYYSGPQAVEKNGKMVKEITDARARVKTQFPDVEEKIKVIGYTQEIPNDPWVIRTNLYKDEVQNKKVRSVVIEALQAWVQTPEGKNMLKVLTSGSGLVPVNDSEYATIRELVLKANLDLEKLSKKK